MVESSRSLVLGFLGSEVVHRDNARGLLEDLITAHLRNNKGAQVTFILAANPFTETMADLADYCVTQGYKLGLIGHTDDLEQPAIAPYLSDAVGNLNEIKPDHSIVKEMVATLVMWSNAQSSSRLILVGDTDDDDAAYIGAEDCIEKSIPVRSLLKGLDIVQFKSDEKETTLMPVDDEHELEEEEFPEDLDDDETAEEEPEEPTAEDLEEPDDDDSVEDEDEDTDLEPDTVDEDEVGDEDGDEVIPEEGEDPDDNVEDFDGSDEPDDATSPDDEENEGEPMPAPVKSSSTAPVKWTEAKLNRLAERDRDEFLKVAKRYKVVPARGLKNSTMSKRVMEAIDGKPRTAVANRKTAKSKTASTKNGTVKRGPGRPRKTESTAPAARKGRPPASAATNGHVPKAEARTFIELAESALKIAKTLV